MLGLIVLAFSAYLTYYTVNYGRQIWKTSKFSSLAIFVIAVSFLPLAVYVEYIK